MSSRRTLARSPLLLAALVSFAPAPAPARAARGHEAHPSLGAHDHAVVQRVVARAAARLAGHRCGQVLADFKDRAGRPLDETLQARGASAPAYLQGLTFLDGSRLPRCRARSVTMATSPGRPEVFVCPAGTAGPNSRLARVEAQSPSLAEAMVIHEMLHTLGLGEDPPSTFEITERVRRRCR